jgi:hypothetical protein
VTGPYYVGGSGAMWNMGQNETSLYFCPMFHPAPLPLGIYFSLCALIKTGKQKQLIVERKIVIRRGHVFHFINAADDIFERIKLAQRNYC